MNKIYAIIQDYIKTQQKSLKYECFIKEASRKIAKPQKAKATVADVLRQI